MAGAEDREAVSREGVDLASKAVQSTPDDPETLGVAAFAFGYFSSQDIDAAKALIDRSVALSPSRAHSWLVSGWLRLWAGEPEVAIGHLNTSLRLHPSIQELPNFGQTYRFLAATYAHLGRLAEARDAIIRLRAVSPVLMACDVSQWRNPEHR